VCQDYLILDFDCEFDAALLIYCDLGPLLPAERDTLLDRVHRSLVPGGLFAFNVLTAVGREQSRAGDGWYASQGGFWNPGPHVVLSRSFSYPGEDVELDQYVVIDERGDIRVYRLWPHYYSSETISEVLEAHGFVVDYVGGDLSGTPYSDDAATIGIVARRPG